jgi:hypothetical protein
MLLLPTNYQLWPAISICIVYYHGQKVVMIVFDLLNLIKHMLGFLD